jgi:hypothetical protein
MAPVWIGRWFGVGFLAVAFGACVIAQPSVVIGDCALRIQSEGTADDRALSPPYVIELTRGMEADTGIGVIGIGWRNVDVTITEPGGDIHDDIHLTGDSLRFDTNVFGVGKPGTWRFRLSDDVAGCVREFSVEVVAI